MNEAFYENLFELFHRRRLILVAKQDGWEGLPVHSEMETRVEEFFGRENTIHLVPSEQATEPGEFYGALADKFQLSDDICSPVTFTRAVEKILNAKHRLLLLITGFERIREAMMTSFAGTLREMDEMHSDRLRILICGGEKLDSLYFNCGTLSLSYLNSAEMVKWPEPTAEDVCRLCGKKCGASSGSPVEDQDLEKLERQLRETIPDSQEAKNLQKAIAQLQSGRKPPAEAGQAILEITGGHPLLIDEAIRYCSPDAGFDADACEKALLRSNPLMRSFMAFKKPGDAEAVCRLLEKNNVGPNHPIIFDPLTRRLYWANLLKPDDSGDHLSWRCDIVVKTGRMVLCEN